MNAFGIDEGVLTRMMRPTCSDCGSADLLRGRVVDVMAQLTPDERQSLGDGLEWLERTGALAGSGSQCWICRRCGEMGIFSGVSSL